MKKLLFITLFSGMSSCFAGMDCFNGAKITSVRIGDGDNPRHITISATRISDGHSAGFPLRYNAGDIEGKADLVMLLNAMNTGQVVDLSSTNSNCPTIDRIALWNK